MPKSIHTTQSILIRSLHSLHLVLGGCGTAPAALSIAVWSMAIHRSWRTLNPIEGSSAVAVVLVLVLLSFFALMFVLEVFVDCDSAADDDCFLDEAHCVYG